jgi:hypothetical protein
VDIQAKRGKRLLLGIPVLNADGTEHGMNEYFAARLTAYTNETNANVLFTINTFNASNGSLYFEPDNQGHYRGNALTGVYIHNGIIDLNIQAEVMNLEPGYYSFDFDVLNTLPITPGSPTTNSAFQAFATGTLDIQPSRP